MALWVCGYGEMWGSGDDVEARFVYDSLLVATNVMTGVEATYM